MIENLKDETFGTYLTGKTVLVDFWAEWCGPCKVMLPILEEVNNGDHGFEVAKVNVDEFPEIASEYGVRSIPTMVLFVDGQEKGRIVGAFPKVVLLREVNKLLQA
jgi:thioredoxin 1